MTARLRSIAEPKHSEHIAYIRHCPEQDCEPWWLRFEATLVQRYVGTDALQKHVEDRRAKLDAHGALLRWEKDTGLPYLQFRSEQDQTWFLLKWS
jgi:hypothetical protein